MSIQGVSNMDHTGSVPEVKTKKVYENQTANLSSAPVEDKFETSTGKKIGVGAASFFMPGLGQLINGENKKGAKFFGTSVATSILAGAVGSKLVRKGNIKAAAAVSIISSLGMLANQVISIVDAVKNAKSD